MDPYYKLLSTEKRVLAAQNRLMEQKLKADQILTALEREASSLATQQSEWLKKKTLEEERNMLEMEDLKRVHRQAMEELKMQYEQQVDEKTKDIRLELQVVNKKHEEIEKMLKEGLRLRREGESKVRSKFQALTNEFLREQDNAARRGIYGAVKRTIPESFGSEVILPEASKNRSPYIGKKIRNIKLIP